MSERPSTMQVPTNAAAFALNTARERTVETHAMVEARAEREKEEAQFQNQGKPDAAENAGAEISLSSEAEAALQQTAVGAVELPNQTSSQETHSVDIVV